MTTVEAMQLETGDVVSLPGWMLHEDLSGLSFEVDVIRTETVNGFFHLIHQDGRGGEATTWLHPTEKVELVRDVRGVLT